MRKKILVQLDGDKKLKEGYERFYRTKEVMNSSKETLKFYEQCFSRFSAFFGEERNCNEIDNDTVTDYLIYLREQERKLAQKTIESYLRGLRAILYFFMENGYMESFHITLPKSDEVIKETYTESEVQKLVAKPNLKKSSFSELRNWAMVCYFLATGNRLGTVSNLKIGDIDFKNDEILIRKTKNRRQQLIPLSQGLKQVLSEYLQHRQGNDDDYLFCNAYGHQLTKDSMTSCISSYNHGRGVTKTSIHLFRHTFAKNWILNGGDIFRLQKILGHSTLDMVKQYVAMFGGDLKRDFERFSVLDQARNDVREKNDRIKIKKLDK